MAGTGPTWPSPQRLIPVATVTHTEPFHISKAIATLDFISHGRAGWQVRVSGTPHEADLFGRRDIRAPNLFDEASDAVEVARRLWDSWEDDAVIRDVATGRFVDRDKLQAILGEVAQAGGADLKVYADVFVSFAGITDPRSALRDHLGL